MSVLRAVVVDDEPLAREGLAEQLGAMPDIQVVATFADAIAALAGIETLKPDVVFVDIRMPGMSGIELVENLQADPMPAIVFVTAYDAHAIRAFDLNAADYLLKPVAAPRLAQTVTRLRERAGAAERGRILAALREIAPGRHAGRLIVREVGQIIVVPVGDIDWIEAADYYARLHTGARAHLLRETLASLEQRLDPARFLRVHRSAIVNLARVRAVESQLRGDAVAVLTSGARVRVTAARREELERRIQVLNG